MIYYPFNTSLINFVMQQAHNTVSFSILSVRLTIRLQLLNFKTQIVLL